MTDVELTPEKELESVQLPGDHDRSDPRVLRGDWRAVYHFREITTSDKHPEGLELIEVLQSRRDVFRLLPEVLTALLRPQDPELDVERVRPAISLVNVALVMDEIDAFLDRMLEGQQELRKLHAGDDDHSERNSPEPADPTTSGS